MPSPDYDDVEIIPTEDIKGESTSFNVLIFRQLERINYMWSQLLSSKVTDRKENLLELYLSIRAAETLMWARLGRDKSYVKKRKELGINDPSNFRLLASSDLANLLNFTDLLDKWYKLITRRLDRFNFFPPIDLYDFTNLDDLKKMENIEEDFE